MKIHEKSKYFEALARKREGIISVLVPLLRVEWTPEIRHQTGSPFWTQYAFVTVGSCQETLVAFHVRYSTDQPSLANRRDKYSVLTCEEAKRQPAAYGSPAFLTRLHSLN
jgi:hypothetical protein